MLHVFPEVDSKHSESEWNQDSVNVKRETKKCGVRNLCPVLDRHKNVAVLNRLIGSQTAIHMQTNDKRKRNNNMRHSCIKLLVATHETEIITHFRVAVIVWYYRCNQCLSPLML